MLTLTREACRTLESALSREWLVANGAGGYASSTICGANTRRYHGLLVAALQPPLGRTLLLAKIDEQADVNGASYYLGTNEYGDGTIHPSGLVHLERFELDGNVVSFVYTVGRATLEKRVWMEHGLNTTYVQYRALEAPEAIALILTPFAACRDYHAQQRGRVDWNFDVTAGDGTAEVVAYPGATPLRLLTAPAARFTPTGVWYWNFLHRMERERGMEDREDLYAAGLFRATLQAGGSLTLVATTEDVAAVDLDGDAAYQRERDRLRGLLARAGISPGDDFGAQLTLAADQFLVRRDTPARESPGPLRGGQGEGASVARPTTPHEGRTVIAGYHWFGDWGRDTMICLPGLTVATGRLDDARSLLRSFAGFLDKGMIPNRFPEHGQGPEYTSVDATLWYFQALRHYLAASGDADLLWELLPALRDALEWYRRGTRHGIHADPADGLLVAAAPGLQLTWMDAKVGDWVVTPRAGKPVEVNALWYGALRLMEIWSAQLGEHTAAYAELADQIEESFSRRFWNPGAGCLFDVVDGPNGDDPSVRPNQLFAVSLHPGLLDPLRAASVIDVVRERLLTPYGLRSLAPGSEGYRSQYVGSLRDRDATYHQGAVWPWLLGAYLDAEERVAGRVPREQWAEPFCGHLLEAGLGTISEIFDAEEPYLPRGCIAQAWSVAELLRHWKRDAMGEGA